MYRLQPISEEQRQVLDKLTTSCNVIVDSVAGSGKTTCILHIASLQSNESNSLVDTRVSVYKRILVLTYNTRLRKETKERCKKLGLTNVDVHTYHSFCYHHYSTDSGTDKGLYDTIENNLVSNKRFDYDLFVIDEVQDMTPLFFEIFTKIYTSNQTGNTKIIVFGDKNQCIFRYKLADQRFVELTQRIFKRFNEYPWENVSLSTSYRVNKEMAEFINTVMLNTNRLQAKRYGMKPIYLVCNSYQSDEIFKEVDWCFENYSADDIFVLGASTKKGNSPLCLFENYLVRKGYRVHVSRDEQDMISEIEMKDKICFSTIHKTKGLERKVVILFGFDESYYNYYKRDENRGVCCNEMYVACTRAREVLILIHHKEHRPLPFLHLTQLSELCEVPYYWTEEMEKVREKSKEESIKCRTVTELVNHLPYEVMRDCMKDIIRIPITPAQELSRSILKQKDHENVSDLTSAAISYMFEYRLKKQPPKILEVLLKNKFEEKHNVKKPYHLGRITEFSTPEMLYLVNAWDAYTTTLIGRFRQIQDYNWITRSMMNQYVDRLKNLRITKNCQLEYEICTETLIGRLDCVDPSPMGKTVYEFKATSALKDEHYLQLAIYMYLYETHRGNIDSESTNDKVDQDVDQDCTTRYYLYNILTDEKVEIRGDLDRIKKHIDYLLYLKNHPKKTLTDEMFLEKCEGITMKYLG